MEVNFDKNNINYNFDDYRKEIRMILERNNKKIKISEVLRECGISKGNYYVFMKGGKKYKDGFVSTLSYSKLDLLLRSLKKTDTIVTNRRRMEMMSDEELARFIEEEIIDNPKAKSIDFVSWLKEECQ